MDYYGHFPPSLSTQSLLLWPWLFNKKIYHIISIICRLKSKFLNNLHYPLNPTRQQRKKPSRAGTKLIFSPLCMSGTPAADLHLPEINLSFFVPPYMLLRSSLCLEYNFLRRLPPFKSQLLPYLVYQQSVPRSCVPREFSTHSISISGFLCGSAGKESACSAGDLGSIPGLGRSPGEGKGYPL